MNSKLLTALLSLSTLALMGCDKGGSNFSVASQSAGFQQASTFTPRKLDVLFVIDNSNSMQSSQNSLAANFPSFINYFKNKGYDFRIAVTSTDAYYGDQFVNSGCSICNANQARFRASSDASNGVPIYVIDNNTPNLEQVFSGNARIGVGGSGDERSFSSFKAALKSPLNANFHRSDAYLSVIIVSDEEDFSHDDIGMDESYTQPTLHSVASYKTFLETFTHGQAATDFSVSTISVMDEACRASLVNGAQNSQKVGTRLMQLADMTGGTKHSLCGAFNTILNNISTSIAGNTQAQFQLNRKPEVSSIYVLIDGIVIPHNASNGWEIDLATNIITIRGTYAPSVGAQITINFDPSLN